MTLTDKAIATLPRETPTSVRDDLAKEAELERLQQQQGKLRGELAEAIRALPIAEAWIDVQYRNRCIPKGFLPVTAFTDGEEIIFLGDPLDEEDDPEGLLHNCDDLGCTSVSHVLARFPHPYAKKREQIT